MFVCCLIAVLTIVSCGAADKSELHGKLESLLSIDIPQEFDVINYREGGLNDYTIRYEIQFKSDDFDLILSRLDLSEWDNLYSGLYTRDFVIDDRSYEYIEITMDDRMITYLYIYE